MTDKDHVVAEFTENPTERARKMLLSFGLSENEAKIYVYLLERGGEIGGSKIAVGANLHRQYVYLMLPKLIHLGLVEEVEHGKLSKYRATAPKGIEKIAKKRMIEAEDIVKELEKFSKVGHEQDFEVLQGDKAIRAYEMEYVRYALEKEKEYIIGGATEGFSTVMGENMEHYLKLKRVKKIEVKYIGSAHERSQYNQFIGKYENQSYRFMEKLPQGKTHMVIRKDTVSFYSFLKPSLVYIIKSPIIAQNYKDFFMMLWDMAGENK